MAYARLAHMLLRAKTETKIKQPTKKLTHTRMHMKGYVIAKTNQTTGN